MKSYVDVTTPHEWQEHSVTSDKKCSVVDRLFGEVLKICLGQFISVLIFTAVGDPEKNISLKISNHENWSYPS